MSPPSYARATTSSTFRVASHTSTSQGFPASQAEPLGTPTTSATPVKKLKRPSTLTPKHCLSLAYKSDLYSITPADRSRPCLLANLPSELRITIYQHVINTTIAHPGSVLLSKTKSRQFTTPSILNVCRAIRIEAAYIFYTLQPFTFHVRNFDLHPITSLLEHISPAHRALLTRNRNLNINVDIHVRSTYTYPPPDYLFDATMQEHWRACSQFGNLYALTSDTRKLDFILFCRLLKWFHFNDARPYRDIRWNYIFDITRNSIMDVWPGDSPIVQLRLFAVNSMGVVNRAWVKRAWTRGRGEGRGRAEAMVFWGDLERSGKELAMETDERDTKCFEAVMTILRRNLVNL
ncbi:hypothetical protein EK21DRAFT_60207 [Setomelanomma holmii]|uniref:F-box protein n=1 Tax=Setomelanomma holmii TaxID=210430 RepID=A0A9P4LQF6_9PLEO|nr:hypothetical protein EK21DRAFT_60207 [Setomelanomma holmii]